MDKETRRRSILFRLLFGVLTVAAVLVSVILSRNSFRMNDMVKQRTDSYLRDVSHQIVVHINSRIENSVHTLQMLRDSAIRLPQEMIQDYLDRKKAYSEFQELYLFSDHQAAEEWLSARYPGVEFGVDEAGQPDAELFSIYDEDTIIYCVSDSADSDEAVIVAVKTKQALRELLNQSSFDGRGFSFAITPSGVVITAPTDANLYDNLAPLSGADEKPMEQLLEEMKADVAAGQSGGFTFRDSDGTRMRLRYEPLSCVDWYVVTAIPSDLIGSGVEALSGINTVLTMVTIAMLLASMAAVLLLHSSSRRKLERLAFEDAVTGGMNGTRFRLLAQDILRENGGDYVLVSMDVENFKLINKAFGTKEGNRTLRYLHKVLSGELSRQEPMARDTADVFCFLLRERREEEIRARLEQIYHRVNAFNRNLESPYYIELRFGVYAPTGEDEDLVDMQQKANLARKSQGSSGRCSFYDEKAQERTVQEKELAGMVDRCLARGDFQVYLQPKVALEDLRVAGAEALIRWKHPEKGMLSPAVFIPMAERYRLISRLDLFVFEEVCRTLERWKREGRELMTVSVNLSRQNLDDDNFLERYREICAEYGVSPHLIEFELTETIMFEDPPGVKSAIDEIHAMGFRCSLDDFGTGFSALGLLNDLEVDVIKLDRSFFHGKNNSPRGRCIVESILRLAAQLHIHTVAEGIEDPRQVRYLRRVGCDMVQGFCFFRPMPVEEFEDRVFEGSGLRCVELAEEPGGES